MVSSGIAGRGVVPGDSRTRRCSRVRLPKEIAPAPTILELSRFVVEVCAELEEEVLAHGEQQLRGEGDPMEGYDASAGRGQLRPGRDRRPGGSGTRGLAVGGSCAGGVAGHTGSDAAAGAGWRGGQRSADAKAIIGRRAERAADRDDPGRGSAGPRGGAATPVELGRLAGWELSQRWSEYQRPHLASVPIHLEDEGVVKIVDPDGGIY